MGLTVAAAIAGLVQVATRTLEMETPTLEQPGDEGPSLIARVRFEVRCVRIVLRQLEQLLHSDVSTIPLYRRAQVELLHLVALLGEGVLALDSLVFHILALDGGVVDADDQNMDSHIQRAEELMDALWRLQDFRTSMWLYLNVLTSPDGTDVPDSLESLDTAAACLLAGDSKVAKRLRNSDVYSTLRLKKLVRGFQVLKSAPGSKLTLADVNCIVNAAVPVFSGDLLDPLPYFFEGAVSFEQDADDPYSSDSSDSSSDSPIHTPSSSPPPSPRDHGRHTSTHAMPAPGGEVVSSTPLPAGLLDPYSCAAIFHLDITTPNMVLCFFQHALAISPRFKTHDLPDIFSPPDPLELVRQQKAKQKAHPSDNIVAKFRLHNLSNTIYMASCSVADEEAVQTRLEKQQKLRGLSDHQLRCLCVEVYDELVRRNIVDNRLKALVDCTKGGYGGYLVGGPNVRQEDVEVPPVVGPSSSHGLGNCSGAEGRPEGNKTLGGMEDGKFLELCADACWELRRRDVDAKAEARRDLEARANAYIEAAVAGKGKGKAGSDTESRLPEDSGTDDSEDADGQDDDEDSEVESGDVDSDYEKFWQRQGARRREKDAHIQARFLDEEDDYQDEEEDDDYQDGSQLRNRGETTDGKEADEGATTQEENSEARVESDEASDLDDVEEIWERHSARRRERERAALRERFLLEKEDIETVVLKYERRPEFVIYDDSGA